METERSVVGPVGRLALGLFVVLSLSGCETGGPMKVDTYWGPKVQQSFGPSFAWGRNASQTPSTEQALEELIVNSFEEELAGKGYVRSTSGDPDLILNYRVVKKERPDKTGHGWHEEGTLVLDIIDPGSRQRYWRGIAKAKLRDDDPPKVRKTRVTEAIRRLLADFPAAGE